MPPAELYWWSGLKTSVYPVDAPIHVEEVSLRVVRLSRYMSSDGEDSSYRPNIYIQHKLWPEYGEILLGFEPPWRKLGDFCLRSVQHT